MPAGWGATWPAPHGRAGSPGCVPEQQQQPQPKGPASLGGSSPSSALFPPPPLASFLVRARRGRCVRAPASPRESRRSSQPLAVWATGFCRPLVAAPEIRARPGGGRCWEALAGTKPTARGLRLGPGALRRAGLLRCYPPDPRLRRPGVSPSPERARRQRGAKKVCPANTRGPGASRRRTCGGPRGHGAPLRRLPGSLCARSGTAGGGAALGLQGCARPEDFD